MGFHVPQGEGEVLSLFLFHWFEWRIFDRNIFDSCVKIWQYFRTGNISLKTSVYRLSEKLSVFRSKFVFTRNLQKCNSRFTQKSHQAATPSSNLLREVNVDVATIASLPGARFFCAVWAILANLRKHLTCRCLHVVSSSLIALRYGKFGSI